DDVTESFRVEFSDVIDANAEELLGHGDDDRPPALIGDRGESLSRFDLCRGIEHEHRGEVAGGRDMDDGESVTLTRWLRSRLGEGSLIRHPQENRAGPTGGRADICGWEGRLGGDGFRSVVELRAGGIEIFE